MRPNPEIKKVDSSNRMYKKRSEYDLITYYNAITFKGAFVVYYHKNIYELRKEIIIRYRLYNHLRRDGLFNRRIGVTLIAGTLLHDYYTNDYNNN